MMKKEKEELFFVGISEAMPLIREILLSTKNSIYFLKKNEELKELRINKIEKIMQFKEGIKEINALMNKLREKLPKANVRVKEKPVIREYTQKKREVKKEMPKRISELEKLEMELGDIEKKLGRLR